MRKTPNLMAEPYRITEGTMASDISYGNAGAFKIPFQGQVFVVVISDGLGWDHVSVSLKDRIPTWYEMCFFKDLFFCENECAVQYHPANESYVNNHPHCLHLWRSQNDAMPIPDSLLVGIKELGELS